MLPRNVEMLFPTPLLFTKFDVDFCRNMGKEVLSVIQNDPSCKNNEGSATTKDNLHKLPQFAELVKMIDHEVSIYAEEVCGLEPNSLELACMWSNAHHSNSHHHVHQHPNGYISGALYLNIPEDGVGGNIMFSDPRPAKTMQHGNFTKVSPVSERGWYFVPEVGMLIVFPSWLEHGVHKFTTNTNEQRISLSFNYKLTKCSTNTMSL